LPVVVKVRVTFPNPISAAEGVYNALSADAFGVNDPEPFVDHNPPEATVIVPLSEMPALLAHTV
jgi:hypothetical protein